MSDKKITIDDVEKAIGDIYLIADEGIIRILYASVISNRLFTGSKPVWLLILAGSSGGKTMLLQTLDKVGPWITPIDTLTTNTFASGLQRSEETSLLWKANNGVIVFKDFTTLTSMNEEGLREIMGQLRGIYDGSFDKKTGNANDTNWIGKIGIVAGGTIAVQRKMRQFSENGERFINYCIHMPNSVDLIRRALKNQREDFKHKEEELKHLAATFINKTIANPYDAHFTIPEKIEEELIQVSNFCTLARSPVITDRKTGKVIWVPEREEGARVAIQFVNLAKAMMIMCREDSLSQKNARILYKCAFDSIPADRRVLLKLLTQYEMASTKNLAIRLNYPTDTVSAWCSQLNALKMVDRVAKIEGSSDGWELKKEYREVVSRFEQIKITEDTLAPTEKELERYGANQEEVDKRDESLLSQIYGGQPTGDAEFNDF